jgi:CHAT domain-containing protein
VSSDVIFKEVRNYHLVHMICHGFFDFNEPLQSYLGLSGSRLTLEELFEKLELPEVSLAVLSACETGVVELSRVDEYIGLPSGFISAGAPTVVSSLWMAHDETTSHLMGKFYQNLRAGMRKVEALNEAQRWLRDFPKEASVRTAAQAELRFSALGGPSLVDYSHPFYWAAFYLSGAP